MKLTALFGKKSSVSDDGIMCIYPHPTGKRTAAEYHEPEMRFKDRKVPLTWTQVRQYGAEDRMGTQLPEHRIGSEGEAQKIADKVTKHAKVRPVIVSHTPERDYSFAQAHPDGGTPRIVLGHGGMSHATLLHELTHHIDREKGTEDEEEPHGDSFRNHFEQALVDHHPNSYVAREAFRDKFQQTDQLMRMGNRARFSRENPEMNEREKAQPPVPAHEPMWEHDPETLRKARNAVDQRSEPHTYRKYMHDYPELDYDSDDDYERGDAHMADEDLEKGLHPRLVPPHMLDAWVKHHPNPKALEDPEYDDEGEEVPVRKQAADEGTVRMVAPEEYRKFHFPDYPTAKTLPALVRHFKKTDPEYYGKVRDDIQQNGFKTPILVRYKDPRGNDLKKPEVMEGHHRAAVAHELGMHLPVGDYDNETDFQRSRKGNADWFQKNERGPQGVSWEASRKTAAPAEQSEHTPKPIGHPTEIGHTAEQGVHRGLSVVLPPEIHKIVHDPEQPGPARAHLLLSELKKHHSKNEGPEGEEGSTGGLGNYWAPSLHKAAEIASQNGWSTYHEHEREHGCGDEETGSGGCPTTQVVVHAQTPSEKDHWTEQGRPGEKYDPQVSWRLPVRPGTRMNVTGISWREGLDNQPSSVRYSEEGMHYHHTAPFTRYDFAHPVQKEAGGTVPPGTMGTDSEGHGVQMTTMDGWAHRDGSHGHEDGPDVGERPVYTHDHTWLPHGRYWGPNSAQNDQRLFDGDHLRPEVRKDILERVGSVLDKYGEWRKWATVYFAGSEAAKWQPFNGDFDILITVDMDAFWDENHRLEELTEAEVAHLLTEELWTKANVSDYYFTLADGRKVGPFDRTFFVIAAPDIRDIRPYAAYNVTDDDWTVHPLQVPQNWSAQHLPEAYWGYAEALVNEIQAIGQLPAEERHRMAANLYEELHTHRSDAFGAGGHGLFDLSNIVEKYLDQHPDKPWAKLVQWKNESPSGASPWVPTTARRTTLTDIFDSKLASFDSKLAADGADHGGVMIALVPPKKICEKLAQEDGEPVDAMHVTLAYMPGLDRKKAGPELKELVEGWARTQKTLTAHIGGVGTFVNPGQHVLWAAVDLPHGGPFRQSLVEVLERHGYDVANDHGWTPHITLDYRDHHVRFLPKVEPATWDVTEVAVCVGDNWTAVPLG